MIALAIVVILIAFIGLFYVGMFLWKFFSKRLAAKLDATRRQYEVAEMVVVDLGAV